MKKKIMIFGMISILALAFVSAGLVSHFAKIKTNIAVESPLTLEQSIFTFNETEVLNDGQNHYLLIKGMNNLDVEVPADVVITITAVDEERSPFNVDGIGLHLAVDAGGDMHYCYESGGNMTGITDCDTQYVQWLENNADRFDWVGTDSTYELSGFESPIVNHNGNSWTDASPLFVDGVLTLPVVGVDPGIIAALLVIRADIALVPGDYEVKVEFIPVIA